MAVDKKSQHVGNHGGRYTDIDGQTKQFTVIDHDKKLKITPALAPTDSELEAIKRSLEQSVKDSIEFVLLMPALNIVDASGGIYNGLVKMNGPDVVWNVEEVTKHLTANINSFLPTMIWRRTVPEIHWFHPAWMNSDKEFFKSGNWRELIP